MHDEDLAVTSEREDGGVCVMNYTSYKQSFEHTLYFLTRPITCV